MKKFLLALFMTVSVFCLTLGFVACGDEKADGGQNVEQSGNSQNGSSQESNEGNVDETQKPNEQKPEEQGSSQESNEGNGGESQFDDGENASAPVYLGMSIEEFSNVQDNVSFAGVAWSPQNDEIYHSHANSDILIMVHFKNPMQYEIFSFLLNGRKYVVNMFERGSDLENIILRVSVGDFDEATEYTIDAIKCIEGEKIESVKMAGERTVKLYRDYEIAYHDTFDAELPTAYTVMSERVSFEDLSASRAGYNFLGFYSDEACTQKAAPIEKGSKGDRVIYAKWEIVRYNIEYVLDGGENSANNPTSCTIEDKAELVGAKKDGNLFIGWYRDEEHKELVRTLENATEDVKLYARWEVCSERLTFKKVADGYSVSCDSDYYNYPCDPYEIVIPNVYCGGEPVTEIESRAFVGCIGLTSITIPANVKRIGKEAFVDVQIGSRIVGGLSKVNITDLSAWCKIDFGDAGANPLFCTFGLTLAHLYLNGTEITDLKIPDDVTSIKKNAFCGVGITSVTFHNGITSVGANAFFECRRMEKVNITDLSAFYKMDFGNEAANPLYVAHHLYLNGSEITDLKIPDGITSIGDFLFAGCAGFTGELKIPASVISIGKGAFWKCNSLTSVAIPASVISIGKGAFGGSKIPPDGRQMGKRFPKMI